jgi:N-acetylneuraminic acid mutarotase
MATSTIYGCFNRRRDRNTLAAAARLIQEKYDMRPRASRALSPFGAATQRLSLVTVALALTACGGGTYVNPTYIAPTVEATNYTVGGTITGLTVSGVILANGTATVSIAADASTWEFPTTFAPGTSYSVTVQTQPTGEQCAVTANGSGMNTGNVDNIVVVCGFGHWTWEGGSQTANASGIYGTQGAAAATNLPGARYAAGTWTDSSGNFWLFGGVGADAAGATGYLNDLWEYSPSTKQWTWAGGLSTLNSSGVYGAEGAAATTNLPGARSSASTWTDTAGNFWLFGGVGYSSTGPLGNLNDLWKYSPSTGQWTWVSGGTTGNAAGVYGTQGTAAVGNVPGARYAASSWTDSSGNLWLFGGQGADAAGTVGNLNDLWKYSPSTGQWTWISGGNANNADGIYGTQGTAAAGNVPGARYAASTWIDSSGALWLFGGYGYDSVGSEGRLNDLWQYTPSTGQWTWVSGEDAANVIGIYGALGTPSLVILPGARQGASAWIDSSGNFWLFGGIGYSSASNVGSLNDLWEYDPTTKEWTWVSGGDVDNALGVYGTQGTGSVGNILGGRQSASAWIDSSNNLWLFGGYGYDSTGTLGYLDDLWQYDPSTS